MMILLADDSPVSRIALRLILRAEPSWRVVEAEDGRAAWEALEGGLRPDLCLLDIRMPRLNGHELLERMRGDSRFRDTPVVIISTVRNRDVIVTLGRLGVQGYLLKPYVASKALETIRQVLNVNNTASAGAAPHESTTI